MPYLLDYARSMNANVLCLQESQNLRVNPTSLAQQGYNLYHHPEGKVCILVDNIFTEKHTASKNHIWYSDKFDSMALTLTTQQDSIIIPNAYLPSDLDQTSTDSILHTKAREQHAEISKITSQYSHVILTMDGNETTLKHGRMQYPSDPMSVEPPRPSPIHATKDYANPAMACNLKRLHDTHIHLHPHLYSGDHPDQTTNTHVQPNRTTTTFSKIDYILASKSLLRTLSSCRIDNAPQNWHHHTRTNYHKALIATFDLTTFWTRSEPATSTILRGGRLTPGPDYSNFTQDTASLISQSFHAYLSQPATQALYKSLLRRHKSRPPTVKQASEALHKFKKDLLRIATSVLGHTHRPPKKPFAQASPTDRATTTQWENLVHDVGRALGQTVLDTIPLDGLDMTAHISWWATKGITLPTSRKGWARWWHNRHFHKTHYLTSTIDLQITDSLARNKPKEFYKLITKPFQSTKILSLRTNGKTYTDNIGIEKGLTDYLTDLGDPHGVPNPSNTDDRHTAPNPHLQNLLAMISPDDLNPALSDLSNSSGAGHDGIAPRLLKAITTATWTIDQPITPKDAITLRREAKFKHDITTLSNLQPPGLSSPNDNPGHTRKTTCTPTLARTLLLDLLNLILSTKDLPDEEKLSIVTGLPKTGGHTHDTDLLRPIAVGPAISRLLNKILATRFAAALTTHNIIDPAQFAFLPGKNIHEPISSVIECFKHRKSTPDKACYAIYYDISKAYDSIHWQSIKTSLQEIGAPHDFIVFVLNTLRGTHLAMKTNIPGNITPKIQMHKAIKQGCPLAPLLFAVLMNELHKGYRKLGGYTLDKTTPKLPAPRSHPEATVTTRSYSQIR